MLVRRLHDNDSSTAGFSVPNMTSATTKSAFEEFVAVLLSLVLTDGLARNSQPVVPAHVSKVTDGVAEGFMFQAYLLQGANFRMNITDLPYSIRIKLTRYGYGYGIRNSTTWVAVAVLLIYALVVLVHMCVVIRGLWTRKYLGGDSWEDVAELVALAMSSAPSERLCGTGAGIERSGTWGCVVRVREVGGRRLGLRFGGRGEEEGDAGMVEVGKKYL